MPACLRCGAKTKLLSDYCEKCKSEDQEKEKQAKSQARIDEEKKTKAAKIDKSAKQKAIDDVILTTAQQLEGYTVEETIEIITSEVVYGINIWNDFITSIVDVTGGRSGMTENVLENTRKTCLSELKRKAADVGANAVIAIDLDYSEFSGSGKSMLFLVGSGTAVQVKRIK